VILIGEKSKFWVLEPTGRNKSRGPWHESNLIGRPRAAPSLKRLSQLETLKHFMLSNLKVCACKALTAGDFIILALNYII